MQSSKPFPSVGPRKIDQNTLLIVNDRDPYNPILKNEFRDRP